VAEAPWGNIEEDDVDEQLEVAREALDLRARGQDVPKDLEQQIGSGLRRCLFGLRCAVKMMQKEKSVLRPEIKKHRELELKLQKAHAMAICSMASAQLARVECPICHVHSHMKMRGSGKGFGSAAWKVETDAPFEVILEACTLYPGGVSVEALQELYDNLPGAITDPNDPGRWTCTAAAARGIEKDLLGMCPGGRLHLSEQVLELRKEKRCNCEACCAKERMARELIGNVSVLESRYEEIKESVPEYQKAVCAVRRVLRRFRYGEDDGPEDPVFYAENMLEDADALPVVKETWDRVRSELVESDFPLRLAFLDKSASMGFDQNTYDVLQVAVKNCMAPTSGSTLLFLFAAPGETEMILRRTGDPPKRLKLELGCATWFNEPIVRALEFLAPTFAAVNAPQFGPGGDGLTWAQRNGVPPVQVLCLTDGFDNCSQSCRTLKDVVTAVKRIESPVTRVDEQGLQTTVNEPLYLPVVGQQPMATAGKVPVWLCWMAVGVGGQMLLDSKIPPECAVIDAVVAPRFRDAAAPAALSALDDDEEEDEDERGVNRSTRASRARRRAAATRAGGAALEDSAWKPGNRLAVGSAPGRRYATVLRQEGPDLHVLFDDESTGTVPVPLRAPKVAESVFNGPSTRYRGSAHGMAARRGEPAAQRKQMLEVAAQATQDLAAVMQTYQRGSVLALEDATGAQVDVEAELAEASCDVGGVEMQAVDLGALLLDVMHLLGRSAALLAHEERVVAQKLLSAALELLVCGGSVDPAQLAAELAQVAGMAEARDARRIPLTPDQVEGWQAKLARPAAALLELLQARGFVDGSASSARLSVREECRSVLAAVWRFVNPALTPPGAVDTLRRCVDRVQRLRPMPACASSSSTPELRRRSRALYDSSSVGSNGSTPPLGALRRASGSVVNLSLGGMLAAH